MTLTVDMPEGLQKKIDSEVEKGRYQNKSELVRDAIRRLLEEREKASKEEMSEEYAKEIKRRIEEVEEGDIDLEDMRTIDEIVKDVEIED